MADFELGAFSFREDGVAEASVDRPNVVELRTHAGSCVRRGVSTTKRATDIALGIVAVVLAGPMLLVVACLIKISEPSAPVIFSQTRLGQFGQPFRMYKFRTMHVGAEAEIAALRSENQGSGPLFKLADDPRVTSIGRWLRRFSLDELPQLFNVLAGSMSLVGPRPPLPQEAERYEPHEHRRLMVVPGITGLWQVSGRSLLSWEESIRLDLAYVENWSLALDASILARTVVAVLNRRGAY